MKSLALIIALSGASVALAQMGPATAPAPKAAPNTEAPKDTRPVREDLVSPEAAQKIDEEDLIKKLTGDDNKAKQSAEAKLQEVVDRMGSAGKRLQERDPGDLTQETQRRIVVDLDTLIDLAKKMQQQQQQSSGKSQGKPEKQESQGQKSGKQPGENQGGSEAAQESVLRDGSGAAQPGQEMREKGAEGWGNLPPRDRELVTQAQQEGFLPSYKAAIEKYYEELARLSRTGQKR